MRAQELRVWDRAAVCECCLGFEGLGLKALNPKPFAANPKS